MLSNCPQCRKPCVLAPGSRMCAVCVRQEQEYYPKVYEYVLNHPGSSIEEVSEETGVPKDQVIKLMKQGKLQTADTDNQCVRCKSELSELEKAGRETGGKKFCKRCTDRPASCAP